MKREIKFRAWNPNNKKMIGQTVDYFLEFDGTLWLASEDNEGHEHLNFADDSIVVMQFTGLLDRNGKEIYEGDIVKNINGDLRQILYFERGFEMRTMKGTIDGDNTIWWTVVEIIGNIWENKDLLK